MIEHTLICDQCGRIIHANKNSPAQARREAADQLGYMRRWAGPGRPARDWCADCAEILKSAKDHQS